MRSEIQTNTVHVQVVYVSLNKDNGLEKHHNFVLHCGVTYIQYGYYCTYTFVEKVKKEQHFGFKRSWIYQPRNMAYMATLPQGMPNMPQVRIHL